jgi:hypothetical protein
MSLLPTAAEESPKEEAAQIAQAASLDNWLECLELYRADQSAPIETLQKLLAQPANKELPEVLLSVHRSAKYIQHERLVHWFVEEVGGVLANPLTSVPQIVILAESLRWLLTKEQRREMLLPLLDRVGQEKVAGLLSLHTSLNNVDPNPIIIKNVASCGYIAHMENLADYPNAELLVTAFMDGYLVHLVATCEWDDKCKYEEEFKEEIVDALDQWVAEPEVVQLLAAVNDDALLEAAAEPHFQAMNAWNERGYREQIYTMYTNIEMLPCLRLGTQFCNYSRTFTADSSYVIGKAIVICLLNGMQESVLRLLQLLKKRSSTMSPSGEKLQTIFLQTAFFVAVSIGSFTLVSIVLREAGKRIDMSDDLVRAATRYAAFGGAEKMAYALCHIGGRKEDIYWGAICGNWKIASLQYQLPGSQDFWSSEKSMLEDFNGTIEAAEVANDLETAEDVACELNRLIRMSLLKGYGTLFEMLVDKDHQDYALIRRSIELLDKHTNYAALLAAVVRSKSIELFDRVCEIVKSSSKDVRRTIAPIITSKTLPMLESLCAKYPDISKPSILKDIIKSARSDEQYSHISAVTWLLNEKLPDGQPAIGVQDIAKCIILLLGDGDDLRDVPAIHFPKGDISLDVKRVTDMLHIEQVSAYPHLCSCDGIYGSTCNASRLLVLLLDRIGLSKETLPTLLEDGGGSAGQHRWTPLKDAILASHSSSLGSGTAYTIAYQLHRLLITDKRPCPNLLAALFGTTPRTVYSLMAKHRSKTNRLTTNTRNYMLAIGCSDKVLDIGKVVDDESKQSIYALSRRLGNDVAKHPALELMATAELAMREFTCNDTASIMMSYL